MKLHLGCGGKILDGYVNVDAVGRAGAQPDVVADIRDLPYEDAVADEILSVHVIEHFHPHDAPPLLTEWTRVLKPGGRMVIECPNLLAAAAMLLAADAAGTAPDEQMTLWAFFSSPNESRDPYQVHRWGYTPSTLSALMQRVGLVGIRREKPHFKFPKRDMRIVGVKPIESRS